MLTATFWKAAIERAVKSAAQVAILTIGADSFNVVTMDWSEVAGFSGGGLVLSLLTSIAFGAKDGNPSATNAEVATEGARVQGHHHYSGTADRLDP